MRLSDVAKDFDEKSIYFGVLKVSDRFVLCFLHTCGNEISKTTNVHQERAMKNVCTKVEM